MARVDRFEDLIAWQKARSLAGRIHGVVNSGTFARDFAFRNQLWSAALSISSNIAEGFERSSRREFAHFLSIAKGSCAEVRSDVHIAFDVGHINEETRKRLLNDAWECARVIGGLRASIIARSTIRKSLLTPHSSLVTPPKQAVPAK